MGQLTEGYEANFLVLEGKPLENPAYLHDIRTRVKAGKVIPK